MPLITIKHTQAAYSKIKKELSTLKTVINYIVQALFLAYYVYLLVTKIGSIVHIVLYSVLLAVLVISFILELCMKDKQEDTIKEKKIRKQNKKIIKLKKNILTPAAHITAETRVQTLGPVQWTRATAGHSCRLVQSTAQELPYAMGEAIKKQTTKDHGISFIGNSF